MKKNVFAIILTLIVSMGIAAQGYPVIDITNVVQSVQNGYTMVEQLQALYTSLRTSYEQLQQQIKNFESFDINTLNARDPLGSWRSMTTYANRMMTYEQNIESIINKKDIKIGGTAYSMADLFSTMSKYVVDNVNLTHVDVSNDPFEKRLSKEESKAFKRKFGVSFGDHTRINHLGTALKKKASEIAAYTEGIIKNLAEDREKLNGIVEGLFDSESIVQQQQINNAVMAIMAQDVKTLSKIMGDIASQYALSQTQAQIEKEAIKDEINTNDLDIPEGLIKMLNDNPSGNKYK